MVLEKRNLTELRCDECGREPDIGVHPAGWVVYPVDLPDDPDPPEVVVYCPRCFLREFATGDT